MSDENFGPMFAIDLLLQILCNYKCYFYVIFVFNTF